MASATKTDTYDISVADEIGEAIADGLTSHGFDVRELASDNFCCPQLTNVQTPRRRATTAPPRGPASRSGRTPPRAIRWPGWGGEGS